MFDHRNVSFKIIANAFLLLILTACTMATPEIRLNAGGVEMSLKQEAPSGDVQEDKILKSVIHL